MQCTYKNFILIRYQFQLCLDAVIFSQSDWVKGSGMVRPTGFEPVFTP